MNSATALTSSDRCARKVFYERTWQRNILSASEVLRRSIEVGLSSKSEDPGQDSGDEAMSLCVERGLDIRQSDLYGASVHIAALADFVVWTVRGTQSPWERPEDVKVGSQPWRSGCFLSDSGTRLKAVLCTDRWDEARELSTLHSWFYTGEAVAYQMPLDLTVVITGQRRDARWHGPLTCGWTHPVSKLLRMRKRDGKGFSAEWKKVYREEWEGSREGWLDVLTDDGILGDVIIPYEVPVHEESKKISSLIERKLAAIREQSECPPPQPSVCDGVSPCQFRDACWNFKPPGIALGYIRKGCP